MILLSLLALTGLARPLMPIDETRYAAVAWEMWTHGDFLVPRLDGVPYDHKPPLLFWLLHAGWAVFGVNAWWPRLISPLFTAGTLAVLVALARRLWPDRPDTAVVAPLLLIGAALPALFASALMFDAMLAFFVTLGWLGLVRAGQDDARAGFITLALGFAGALLAKGPVAFVHLLPPMLLAPWWQARTSTSWARWFAGCAGATAFGVAVVLAWAVPAALAGGEAYREAIFWRQSAGRMVDSFAHVAPWWFHLAGLPLTLAPWLPWTAWWKGWRQLDWRDGGLRLMVALTVPTLLFFSMISGKRWQYLLPEFGIAALLAARALDGQLPSRLSCLGPALMLGAAGFVAMAATAGAFGADLGIGADVAPLGVSSVVVLACALSLVLLGSDTVVEQARRLASVSVLAVTSLSLGVAAALRVPYDVEDIAAQLSRFERESRPVAINTGSHGQWTFAGRLREPLTEVTSGQVPAWLARHPDGRVLFVYRSEGELPDGVDVVIRHRWRSRWIAVVAPKAASPTSPGASS